ncbi:MAG: lipid IV(A) 3-deoxy-D-manno-octulosonic acid transferase [Chromatiales bacterium]|nr:lipid IV(A) 3-deoxy-D-manno-octulosonic acid transferase [Chromatiales bacterium]
MLRLAYRLLGWLAAPLLFLHLCWRAVRDPAYRRGLPARFGLGLPTPPPAPVIWLHAVSVGEVQAAAPLVRALLRECPDTPVLLTTMTPTGAERVRSLFGEQVLSSWVPYDLPGAVRRFLDWARPRLVIIMETELWPNLYAACGQRNVPLVLASARISPRSVARYRRLLALFSDTLSHGVVIAAQSRADAGRFLELGADPSRTRVTGNIKFDLGVPDDVATRGRAFRDEHAQGRPVWVAASTHEGEEELVLAAHRRLLARHPDGLLLLVPRHPQRFAQVASLLERDGWSFARRSGGAPCMPDMQVYLGDSMGELLQFYAASDLAFVGGSLVPVGGHNLLEPVALGVPALTGPHTFNSAEIAAQLTQAGAVEVVADADSLADRIAALLDDASLRDARAAAGQRVLGENRGSLDRLLELIRPLL